MSEKTNTGEKEISELYKALRNVPWSKWTSADPKKFIAAMSKEQRSSLKNPDKFGPSLVLLARAAHETTKEVFTNCLANGEIPPMKLSAQEMELVSGGFNIFKWIKDQIVEATWELASALRLV